MKSLGKKGIWEHTVSILMIIATLVVLLVVTGAFTSLYGSIIGKNTCTWSFLVSSISDIPAECRMQMKNITLEDLDSDSMKIYVTQQFNRLTSDPSLYTGLKTFKDVGQKGNYDKNKMREYAMDKLVAEEVKDCWDMVGHGSFNAFDRWWIKGGCDTEKAEKEVKAGNFPDTSAACMAQVSEDHLKELDGFTGTASSTWQYLNAEYYIAPRFCVLCSRIKFDDKIASNLGKTHITSLGEMMQNTPVSAANKISYYEYVTKNDDLKQGIWAPNYEYSIDKPLVVIYSRTNKDLANTAMKNAGSGVKALFSKFTGTTVNIEGDIDTVSVVPYTEEVRAQCTFIANY